MLVAAQARSQEAAGQWVSHTQAEIRRGRRGFLPPVLCFKFVMAGRPWAGLAAVLILVVVAGYEKCKRQAEGQGNIKRRQATGKTRHGTADEGLAQG